MSAATVPELPVPRKPVNRAACNFLRWAGAFVCVFAALYAFGMWLKASTEAESFSHNPTVSAIAYTDPVKSAITQKVDGAKSVLQASFLVFAVLWGVILAKKGEGKLLLGDWPELAMFFAANFCFLISWTYYLNYADSMAAIQSQADTSLNPDDPKEQVIPDYRTDIIGVLPDRQYTIFVLALAATGVTLLSAHLLKESPTWPAPTQSPSPG